MITYDDYRTCLFKGKTIYREQMLFENKKHKYKIVVNRNNDERRMQSDDVTKLARGYLA